MGVSRAIDERLIELIKILYYLWILERRRFFAVLSQRTHTNVKHLHMYLCKQNRYPNIKMYDPVEL